MKPLVFPPVLNCPVDGEERPVISLVASLSCPSAQHHGHVHRKLPRRRSPNIRKGTSPSEKNSFTANSQNTMLQVVATPELPRPLSNSAWAETSAADL
jgi:hypothetical protein